MSHLEKKWKVRKEPARVSCVFLAVSKLLYLGLDRGNSAILFHYFKNQFRTSVCFLPRRIFAGSAAHGRKVKIILQRPIEISFNTPHCILVFEEVKEMTPLLLYL